MAKHGTRRLVLAALLAAACLAGSSVPVLAKEEATVEVYLGRKGCEAEIFLYRVGNLENGVCVTEAEFAASGVDFNGLEHAADVREAAGKLARQQERDKIPADAAEKTEDGAASLSVAQGVYLGTALCQNGVEIQPFLVSLPYRDGEGGMRDNIEIHLKSEAAAWTAAGGRKLSFEGEKPPFAGGAQTGDAGGEKVGFFALLAALSGSAAGFIYKKGSKTAQGCI